MKTHLPNVTLINMDCVSLEKTKRAADICELDFSFGAVKILSSISDSDSRIIPIPAIKSREELSNFYITELWKYVDTEFALCFHPDGFILNPSAWTDDFLDYDYIGAPWYHLGEIIVGNGGFAIRSKRLLEYIGKNYKKIGGEFHPEDLWLSEQARPHLEKEGMTFAPEKIAARFSKEGNNRGVVWNGEFGWHGLNYTDISKWFDIHPEYRKFFPQKFDEFTEFMRKYPVYDGTVHVLMTKPLQVPVYKKLAREEKNYDCRIHVDIKNLDYIQPGHKIVYRLFRITSDQVGVPIFERKVKNIENFLSKKELQKKHPKIEITPSFNLPKWQQYLFRFLPAFSFPNNSAYTIFWFDKK